MKVERKIKQKGTKGLYINVHRKYLGIKIRNFLGMDLKINIIPRIVWGRNLLFGNIHIYYGKCKGVGLLRKAE